MAGSYIVVFRDDTPLQAIDQAVRDVIANGGRVTTRFNNIMKGFSAQIPDAHLQRLNALQGPTGIIEYIEPDGAAFTQLQPSNQTKYPGGSK